MGGQDEDDAEESLVRRDLPPCEEGDARCEHIAPPRRALHSARVAALAALVSLLIVFVLGYTVGRERAGSAAGGPDNRDLALGSMFDIYHPEFQLEAKLQRLIDALQRAMDNKGSIVPVHMQGCPIKAETIVTASQDPESDVIELIGAGNREVTITGIVSLNKLARARIVSPAGWITVSDLSSYHSRIDKTAWPSECYLNKPLGHTDYVVVQDRMPVTRESSLTSNVIKMLDRNEVVHVAEVQDVYDESAYRETPRRSRGRMADGGWVTLAFHDACTEPLAALPAALPPLNDVDRADREENVGVTGKKRMGSFLIVGDWGWDAALHWNIKSRVCQELNNVVMLQKFAELGDVKFIVNVGDSFYPRGVSSNEDPQWQTKWRDVYQESLRSIPWHTVYGNHDLYLDPCTCTEDINSCALINKDITNTSRFHMPDTSYFVDHPELDLEVIALDLNYIGDKGVCPYTSCPLQCKRILRQRSEQAKRLFFDRIDKSPRRTLLIFSHYPTDYLGKAPELIRAMQNDERHTIIYAGGHRHSTDKTSVIPITPGIDFTRNFTDTNAKTYDSFWDKPQHQPSRPVLNIQKSAPPAPSRPLAPTPSHHKEEEEEPEEEFNTLMPVTDEQVEAAAAAAPPFDYDIPGIGTSTKTHTRTSTSSTTTTNTKLYITKESWVVGGGGGLSCDGPQGFLVGEIDELGRLTTHPVILDYATCCG